MKIIIEKIYAHIGLKTGAEIHEKIAVCIAGELIQVKNNEKFESSYI
ncbi:hypothetical protein [Lutispora thermophila]|uniref:Uncharacterized protein n=1 Tax=Lutispora thermophila DSM 19022 TaxID=1122184 RepID=A0A1M6GDW9_9FIRM|nr:hypothetical protein [Lutispora thermophila]SHJ08130.1 hypothetical protein SAMN02745176_02334 [Lutispora thermophila DSM 19022]